MQEMNKMGLDFSVPYCPRSNFFRDVSAKQVLYIDQAFLNMSKMQSYKKQY